MSLTTESSTNFWLTRPFSERSTQIFLGVLVAALALVTLLHLAVPPENPLHIGAYTVNLFGKYLSYALLAVAVDLVWGYLGILSLGHGAFFAIGGYAMGMYLMRQIGDRGTYGHPVLPDFMVFLNWDSLPWFWQGFDMAWFAFAMVLLAPGLLALVFGFLAFRSRVTGVYLSIITQALTFALMLAFFRNEMGFGGNNGLTDFREIVGFDLRSDATRLGLFLATGIALALGFILCRAIVTSKLGRVSVATRDAEARTRFLGYRVERFQLFVFVVSAMLAGLAGALYVPQVGIINPSEFSPIFSIEIVLWVALGGRATLYGAVIGAILVNYAKTIFTGVMPDAWLFALGAMFVLVTVFLPKGVAGLFHYLKRRKREDNTATPSTPKEISA
ncbi:urea ABC transporter permease subunit UrtC [Vreelandella boliviensis]|uniref:urea ABC transporter permease subunit UrtC n=1 Tax=Vreelandella boliviensis TaxID=223527 RepID=UPI001B8B58CE|nr:urea ABC transporter permease subunit UrtC [Halomonas boliviensis]MBS3669582.1 urea ABC transporter permease subunit UrtC [Halomonas boliviensis]